MNKYKNIFLLIAILISASAWGQVDKKEVRRGNKEFRKENYEAAFQDYLRAVEKDTSSIAANYNMASALYRMEQYDQAQQALDRIKETAPVSASAADYLYNLGDVALQRKDYQAAVKAFGEALVL
ncbi:MAG: tetratricopeptide repeat protein, partial [Bacteroidales bacterium]|nr:tetratricopeptide repeat protein [Bacteroidales bacterium]